MRKIQVGFAAIAVALALGACDKASLLKNAPEDPLEFRRYALAKIGPILQDTVCECCKKDLKLCFEETVSQQGPRCPDT